MKDAEQVQIREMDSGRGSLVERRKLFKLDSVAPGITAATATALDNIIITWKAHRIQMLP